VQGTKEATVETTDETLSLVLFSGTDDRLEAAAVLAAGAAAMERKVNVLLQYWALDAFRADRVNKDHGLSPEAGPEGVRAIRLAHLKDGHQHWTETFRQAKEIGDVGIHACALSMELFGLVKDDLDELVDDVEGVAAFFLEATGPVTFI
jgi:peroxiredoxin family protein